MIKDHKVTGDANAMKLVKDGRNYPRTAKGGGTSNRKLKDARGYIDQGPVTADYGPNHGAQFKSGGPKGRALGRRMVNTKKS